jgi:4-hydroxybenzoate polyprenyltransferase
MAFYRGSALSLLQLRMLPSVKQSRAICGNTRDFSKIYRVPATRIRERVPTHDGRVSATSLEHVKEESSQHSAASWVERWLPTAARPYAMLARLHKPDAIWLYAWPCIWYVMLLLLIGASSPRSALVPHVLYGLVWHDCINV